MLNLASIGARPLFLARRLSLLDLHRFDIASFRSASTSSHPPDGGSSTGPKKPLLSTIIEEEPLDPPIQFSTSGASKWKAHDTHTNINSTKHPWTGVVWSIFTSIFLLYFCVFREENDLDEQMKKSLWERIPGLERQQLDVVLRYNEQTGIATEDIRRRIAELDGKPFDE